MKNSWTVKEIAGFDVFTKDLRFLGQLFDVLPTGANDVFVIRNRDKEILIPALKSVILSIDESEKKITVDLPPGLEDIFTEHQPKQL